MSYFLGIDAGTGGIRASVYDETGRLIGSGEALYSTYFPANGRAEQDTEEWTSALAEAIPACINDAGIDSRKLSSIVCDATTNTLVFLDKNGLPVRRPLHWMDVRAAEEAAFIDTIRSGHPETEVYKPAFRADTMIPKCMWYKKHEPENWKKTATVFEFEDWLNYMLTGKQTLSISVASFRWNYDPARGGLPTALYEAAGIGDVTEKIPKEHLPIGACAGTVTKEAAERFGLAEGIPVYEGTADCNAGMFGLGCIEPGKLALVGGTSTVLLGLSEKAFHMDGVNGTYPDCLFPGTGLTEGGQTASGAILTWFKNTLLPAAWEHEAAERNMNIFDLITEKASASPIGCGGVVMTDYFQGNRAPYADSRARGMFVGLSIGTDTADIARAIYEGVAYGANHCLLAMKGSGLEISEIRACGGICSSPFWLQMHADVFGLPITTVEAAKTCPPLGDALIGAVASGTFNSYNEAVSSMVRTERTYTPDPEAHEAYRFYMERYMKLWPEVRDTVHRLVEHENR